MTMTKKKPKPTAAQAREAAALTFLRSRPRIGEGSLKIWCGQQQPPLPVYQAEDAMAALVDQGLATVTTDQRTGNRSWSAVAPPATATDLQLPELAPAPEAPAVQVSPLASELEPEPEAPAVSEVRAVELPAAEVIAAVQACCAAESVATRRALGALLVKIGQVLAGEHVTPPAPGAEPEGLAPQQLVVWRALSATEGFSFADLCARSGVCRNSASSALRSLKNRGLAWSPRYGVWRRAS